MESERRQRCRQVGKPFHHGRAVFRSVVAMAVILLLTGCTAPYFRSANAPPGGTPAHTLQTWPFTEYWSGIVFNGTKIGFSHLSISPDPDRQDLFRIRCEAAFRIHFMMFDKQIRLRSRDRVQADLTLVDFVYDYDLDGNRKRVAGRRSGGLLHIRTEAGGTVQERVISHAGALYPTSVIGLFPVSEGLQVGRRFRFPVFDGETEMVAEVSQQVLAYEESDLFPGPAFKVRTRLHGQEATTWLDESGRPKLEMSLGGVLIAALESETMAKAYLADAALNKKEALLDFSRVPADRPIPEARRLRRLSVDIEGLPDGFSVPTDRRQRCRFQDGSGRVACQIDASTGEGADGKPMPLYLAPTLPVPAHHPKIVRLAREIVRDAESDEDRVRRLLAWIDAHIEPAPVDVFSAVDVLEGGKAECQGQTFLFAALSRSLKIPTKVVNGIVYAPPVTGFLYHTWAESLLDGTWTAVDPTFGQVPADATHIKLVEGESPSDLFPLVELMGRISVRVRE